MMQPDDIEQIAQYLGPYLRDLRDRIERLDARVGVVEAGVQRTMNDAYRSQVLVEAARLGIGAAEIVKVRRALKQEAEEVGGDGPDADRPH